MREPAEKLAGSCAEAAKIGLKARESCANRLNYFHFRRCANHARDYGSPHRVRCALSALRPADAMAGVVVQPDGQRHARRDLHRGSDAGCQQMCNYIQFFDPARSLQAKRCKTGSSIRPPFCHAPTRRFQPRSPISARKRSFQHGSAPG